MNDKFNSGYNQRGNQPQSNGGGKKEPSPIDKLRDDVSRKMNDALNKKTK